jgi:hypothetical protein
MCIADRCSLPGALDGGTDAPVDGIPIAMDRDGDQIPDDQDNCPDKASPDRGDEDGDMVGDICDPCPIDVTNTDLDGDGVAGSCDPRPTSGGDAIVVFEGFHRMPSLDIWQLIGKVDHSGDALVLTTEARKRASISLEKPLVTNGTVTASVIVDATVGDGFSATSVSLPHDPGNDTGLFCELFAPDATSASNRVLLLFDGPADQEIAASAFAWSTGTTYRLALTRSGSNYACEATAASGMQTTGGMTVSLPVNRKVGIDVDGANAHVAWVLIVSSP